MMWLKKVSVLQLDEQDILFFANSEIKVSDYSMYHISVFTIIKIVVFRFVIGRYL